MTGATAEPGSGSFGRYRDASGGIGIGLVEVQVGQFVMGMDDLFMVGLLRQFQLLFRTAYKIGHFVRSDQRHDNLSKGVFPPIIKHARYDRTLLKRMAIARDASCRKF